MRIARVLKYGGKVKNSFDIAHTRQRAGEIKVEPFEGKPAGTQPALL